MLSMSASGRKRPVTPRCRTIFWSRAWINASMAPTLAKNLIYVVHDAHIVKLPAVDMISIQQLQGHL